MKIFTRCFISLASLLPSLIVSAQYFEKGFRTQIVGFSYFGSDYELLPDQSTLVCGKDGQSTGFLLRTDTTGAILWSDFFAFPNNEVLIPLDITYSPAHIYLSCFGSDSTTHLLKYTYAGQRIADLVLTNPASPRAYSSAITWHNGSLYSFISCKDSLGNSGTNTIAKLDANGTVIWSRDLSLTGIAASVHINPATNHLVTFTHLVNNTASVCEYDTFGTFLTGATYPVDCNQMLMDESGNGIITGFNSNSNYGLIMKVDASGTVLWGRVPRETNRNKFFFPVSATTDSEGNVYCAAWLLDTIGPRTYFLKYDTNGNLLWANSYDDLNDDSYPERAIALNNKDLMLFTQHTPAGGDGYIRVAKTDSLGTGICHSISAAVTSTPFQQNTMPLTSVSLGSLQVSSGNSISPGYSFVQTSYCITGIIENKNLQSGQCDLLGYTTEGIVRFNAGPELPAGKIEIINALGQSVSVLNAVPGQTDYDISYLPHGIYFLIVYSSEQVTCTQKIIR